jgi:hypothetical protein
MFIWSNRLAESDWSIGNYCQELLSACRGNDPVEGAR